MPKKPRHLPHDSEPQNDVRYRAFIENSSEGIWRFEVEKPISTKLSPAQQIKEMYKWAYLAEANEATAQMYGAKSAESLVGMRLTDFMVESDPQNAEYLEAFIKSDYKLSGVDSHEKDLNGDDKYFRNSLVGVVEDGKLVRAWGTQQDVTEHHKAVDELARSRETLSLALRASSMGYWEWDIVHNVLTWSSELKRIFGLSSKDGITYAKYQSLLHPDDKQLTMQIVNRAMKNGEAYRVEHRVKWPDGSVHWVLGQGRAYLNAHGKPVRMVGTSMDIDERKETERRLQESEARFRNMADTAPVLIWVARLDKLCHYFNKPWLEYRGRTLAQEMGNGWTEGVHPDDLKYCMRIYSTSFDKRQPFQMEYRMQRYDGAYRWMLDTGTPRFSETGEFLGYIGSCVDIDDVKRATERRRELEARTAALTREHLELMALNEAKDDFISIASHQLRTPATGVKQYVGMLLEGYGGELTERQISMLKTAYESNERQLSIVDDLLKVAHVDAGKVTLNKRSTDLVALTRSVIQEQSATFESRNQKVVTKFPRAEVVVHADPARIRMVIENLIDNAGKYSPQGKTITIKIMRTSLEAILSVADEGVGVAKKDMPKLFQKFSRVDNPLSTEVGGNGLGLYWVKNIVDLHGGKIKVVSILGKGSIFSVHLPKGKS